MNNENVSSSELPTIASLPISIIEIMNSPNPEIMPAALIAIIIATKTITPYAFAIFGISGRDGLGIFGSRSRNFPLIDYSDPYSLFISRDASGGIGAFDAMFVASRSSIPISLP